MAYRWEGGNPAWWDGIGEFSIQVEAYQFERPEDQFWEPENRRLFLAEALPYAFDVAIGKEDVYAFETLLLRTEIEGDAIWGLIGEAHDAAKAARSLNAQSQNWQHLKNG